MVNVAFLMACSRSLIISSGSSRPQKTWIAVVIPVATKPFPLAQRANVIDAGLNEGFGITETDREEAQFAELIIRLPASRPPRRFSS